MKPMQCNTKSLFSGMSFQLPVPSTLGTSIVHFGRIRSSLVIANVGPCPPSAPTCCSQNPRSILSFSLFKIGYTRRAVVG